MSSPLAWISMLLRVEGSPGWRPSVEPTEGQDSPRKEAMERESTAQLQVFPGAEQNLKIKKIKGIQFPRIHLLFDKCILVLLLEFLSWQPTS